MPSNKYALITGSASGIGLEMARLLAQRGYHLVMVDINQTSLQKQNINWDTLL